MTKMKESFRDIIRLIHFIGMKMKKRTKTNTLLFVFFFLLFQRRDISILSVKISTPLFIQQH